VGMKRRENTWNMYNTMRAGNAVVWCVRKYFFEQTVERHMEFCRHFYFLRPRGGGPAFCIAAESHQRACGGVGRKGKKREETRERNVQCTQIRWACLQLVASLQRSCSDCPSATVEKSFEPGERLFFHIVCCWPRGRYLIRAKLDGDSVFTDAPGFCFPILSFFCPDYPRGSLRSCHLRYFWCIFIL